MTNKHIVLSILALAFTTSTAFAQNGINSPYSRYGFGIMTDRAMGFNKAMAGVAQGFRDGQQINTANPASYSAIDSLTALFDLGVSLYNGNYEMGNLRQNAKNSSFDYFAFQFRVRKNMGVTVGILPYTNINYSFSSTSETLTGNQEITSSYSFTGNGGLHKVFLGAGWRILKPISVGVNGSFIFGDYTHTSTMSFSQTAAYSMVRGYSANISTWAVDFGLQFIQPISKNDRITLGITYGLGHDITNRALRYSETLNSTSVVQGITNDTIKNAFQLPHSFDVGISYVHGMKWRVGADFSLEKWSKCKFPAEENGKYIVGKNQLNDRTKLAIGGEFTPNYIGKSYFSRISYRFGAYYSRSYAKADNTGVVTKKPTEFGITAGFALPIQNRNLWYNSPKINVSLQWVHTNIPYLNTVTLNQNTLKENYLKLCLGLTFSERWFYKWKVQ